LFPPAAAQALEADSGSSTGPKEGPKKEPKKKLKNPPKRMRHPKKAAGSGNNAAAKALKDADSSKGPNKRQRRAKNTPDSAASSEE
jgi:hypothetical protein